MKVIDKLAWIEIQDRKVLSARSKNKAVFYIPGGKREAGESDAKALIREVQEELSVDLVKSSLKYLGTFEAQAHGHAQGIIVKMTCYTSEYKGELRAAAEIAEFGWFDYSDYDNLPPVDKIIFEFLKKQDLID